MVKTIGNPLSWTAQTLGRGSRYVATATGEIGGARSPDVEIRDIGISDLRIALSRGLDDFMAFRSDVVFICIVYPVIGLLLAWFAFDRELLPLLFPLVGGFALIGPVAAIGLYEMSRRREHGLKVGWGDAFAVMGSPSLGPIAALGIYLLAIFVLWMLVANWIYGATLGPQAPESLFALLRDTVTTTAGWAMLVIGVLAGFVFAAMVLAISLVSFPMLIDRHVGLPVAVRTSLGVVTRNPVASAAWGLIVAAGLAVSAATLFIGLIFVLPVLGHATWHLYRCAVVTRGEEGDEDIRRA